MPTYQTSKGKIYDSWFRAKWASNITDQYVVQHIYRINSYDYTLRRFERPTSDDVIQYIRVSPEEEINCRRIIQSHPGNQNSVGDVWVGNTRLVAGTSVSFLFSGDFAKYHLTSRNINKDGSYAVCDDQHKQNMYLENNTKTGYWFLFIKVPNESNTPDYVWAPYEESRLTLL